MKNRSNTIIELSLILLIVIGVAAVLAQDQGESYEDEMIFDENTTDENLPAPESSELEYWFTNASTGPRWGFIGSMEDQVEENLYVPVREKYGMEDPDAAFSRCSSYVTVFLDGAAEVVFADGYYYGTMEITIGCDSYTNYQFKVDSAGENFEIANADGVYVLLTDWLNE
jgi:hypothetical protein